MSRPLAERFWKKVQKTDTCWLWIGARNDAGYGIIYPDGDTKHHLRAHRVSYELNVGPIPEGLDLCHNCPGGDKKHCVNPAHLFPGTPADNSADAVAKGQIPCGTARVQAKLNPEKVREIRRRCGAGEPQWQVAASFGVGQMTISQVVTGKTWKHVT